MRSLTKQLACCLAACVPVVGLVMAVGPAAGASTAAPARAKVPTAAAEKVARSALEQYLSDHRSLLQVPSGQVSVPAVQGATTSEQSTNWSGYADSGTGFSEVSGSWTEPTVTCDGWDFSLVGLWVGIDGDGSDSVEQDGTMSMCLFGFAFHFSWWEMYPTNAVQIVGFTVSPGDHITATVQRTGSSYALSLTDSTNPADSFTTTQTCAANTSSDTCVDTSAEWVAEAPSTLFGISSLADYGTWSLTGATVAAGSTSGTISSFPNAAITMVSSSGATESEPGALNSAGNAFEATWVSS